MRRARVRPLLAAVATVVAVLGATVLTAGAASTPLRKGSAPTTPTSLGSSTTNPPARSKPPRALTAAPDVGQGSASSSSVPFTTSCVLPVLGAQTYTGSVSGSAPSSVKPHHNVTVSGYSSTVTLPGGLTSDLNDVGAPDPLTGQVVTESLDASNATPTSVNAAATPIPFSVSYTAGQPVNLTTPSQSVGPFQAGSTGVMTFTPGSFAFEANLGTALGTHTITCTTAAPVPTVATTTITSKTQHQLQVITTSLPPAQARVDYETSLEASGGTPPYSWSLASGSLPAGLELQASGVITGIPTTRGTSTFTVDVADSSHPAGSATSKSLELTVQKAPPIPRLYLWGMNGFPRNRGVLAEKIPTPVAMPAGTDLVQIASGNDFGLGLTSVGTVYAWGANADGQLGDASNTSGSIPSESAPVAVDLPAGLKIKAIAAGGYHALALAQDGQVYAWGFNGSGQLGTANTASSDAPVPVQLPSGVTVTAIAAGGNFSLALSTSGSVLAWGDNTTGQLGNGTKQDSDLPVTVALPHSVQATEIAAGASNGLALVRDGRLYAWGYNGSGQLGDGHLAERLQPVRVELPKRVGPVAIAAGGADGLALAGNGRTLYAWGYGRTGELGDNTTPEEAPVPVKVELPAGTKLRSIAVGEDHDLALTSNGTVLAWGDNYWGQLGNGDLRNERPVPTASLLPTGGRPVAVGSGPVSNASGALVVLRHG